MLGVWLVIEVRSSSREGRLAEQAEAAIFSKLGKPKIIPFASQNSLYNSFFMSQREARVCWVKKLIGEMRVSVRLWALRGRFSSVSALVYNSLQSGRIGFGKKGKMLLVRRRRRCAGRQLCSSSLSLSAALRNYFPLCPSLSLSIGMSYLFLYS